MRVVEASEFKISSLQLTEREAPTPKHGEILVKISSASLNYRDLAILDQSYMPNLKLPYVPCSDCAGEVVEVGQGVKRFASGDRVVPVYTQGWYDGRPTLAQRTTQTLGAPLSGVLQEYIVIPEDEAVHSPKSLSDQEASTLPIAALTAWNTLQQGGIKAGDTVLLQGTGGVSIFALQFAKIFGAKVIITSSSDEKLKRAQALGADFCINYEQNPEWEKVVREMTDGRGVDIVVETTGATLSQSLAAVKFAGFIGVIGFVGGHEVKISVKTLIGPLVRVQGIATGSRSQLEELIRAIDCHQVKPVIDSIFPLEKAQEAFNHLKSGAHFGKIVIA
jgi:NADPH:quinone reductase-like Zn-dependent oxidoreductase